MSFTLTSTNFNGDVADAVYMDIAEGNEVIEKGAAFLELGVRSKRGLPKIDQTSQPFDTYVPSPITADETMTTDYGERSLEVQDMMIYEEFDPNDFVALWDKWGSVGPFTEIRQNPEFLRDVLAITAPNAGAHLSQLFWAGDTGGAAKLAFFDGIIEIATNDANTVKITPAGVITSANIIAILSAVVDGIPDKDYDNLDYKINMATADYRILQRVNTDTKKTSDGVLGDTLKNLFEQKRIEHFVGLPKDRIVATKSSNDVNSNLIMGFWFDEQAEAQNLRVNRIANNSDEFFMKLNIKAAAQYRKSENIILYLPA